MKPGYWLQQLTVFCCKNPEKKCCSERRKSDFSQIVVVIFALLLPSQDYIDHIQHQPTSAAWERWCLFFLKYRFMAFWNLQYIFAAILVCFFFFNMIISTNFFPVVQPYGIASHWCVQPYHLEFQLQTCFKTLENLCSEAIGR